MEDKLEAGMLQFYLHPDGSPGTRDLSGTGADETTELWVYSTIDNYDPDAMMGGTNAAEWSTTDNTQGSGTNLSIRLQPVNVQRLSTVTVAQPSQWPHSSAQADVAITPGVQLGTSDMTDGSKMEANFTGATLTSDAQLFAPPKYDKNPRKLSYSVAAPHWKKNLVDSSRVQNTGFYEAHIPSGLVDWMGISNPDALAGTYTSGGTTSSLSDMSVTARDDGSLHIKVSNIHYSRGTVTLSPETTAPTADAGSDQAISTGDTVAFDGSSSSDSREITSYEWDVDGDGSYEPTGSSPSHSYGSTGSKTVTLRVTDGNGNTDADTLTVSVSESPSVSVSSTSETTTIPTVTATETATETATPTETATAPVTDTPTETASSNTQTETSPTATQFPTETTSTPTESASGPGFGTLATLVALLAVVALLHRRN